MATMFTVEMWINKQHMRTRIITNSPINIKIYIFWVFFRKLHIILKFVIHVNVIHVVSYATVVNLVQIFNVLHETKHLFL